jgi:hypothetical protein
MTIRKVQIESHLLGMCMPQKGDEQEQHLTISDTGRVWFTRYLVGDEYDKPDSEGVRQASIGKEKARELLDMIEIHIEDLRRTYVTDVGCWNMRITYADGTVEKYGASLLSEMSSDDVCVSKEIHDAMPFDGVVSFGYFDDE